MQKNISVIGLGKLGAPLAAVLAYKGYSVIGVDVNEHPVQLINHGQAPVKETGLQELIQQVKPHLRATTVFQEAILNTEITFIIVPTPSNSQGEFSLEYVLAAVEQIGKVLRYKENFHLVVLTSTVMPGATDKEVRPALETYSGKRCGRDFGLCYNPEFIALGSVIHDMLHPDFILIGESDVHSGEILANLYSHLCENQPEIARMNFVNAELTKLAVNTFVTTKISYANMLSQICERLAGAQVDAVTSALGLDSRIGRRYLKGGLGYGGPCFPRDNIAFAVLARQLGTKPLLAEATDRFNHQHLNHLVETVLSHLPLKGQVGILGLSYKPNTDVIEESQGLALAKRLIAQAISVTLYDPAAMENARLVLGDVLFASSMTECTQQADVVVLAVPWNEFRSLSPQQLKTNSRPTIIDCWRVLESQEFTAQANYIALGVGAEI